jgi:microcystin-dependent protein
MAQPYVGEIRMFAGNFAPAGWALCAGQLMAIAENETLFQLIGTTYGGDGQETFALPDLQGRVPLHQGQGPGILQNYLIAEKAGQETVTLQPAQIPFHNPPFFASTAGGSSNTPVNTIPASPPVAKLYRLGVPGDNFPATLVNPTGGSQPHDNHMPYITINYIISLFGIFPSQT